MLCLRQFWRKEDEGRRKIRARFIQNEKQEMMGGKEEEEKEEGEKKLSRTEEFICNNEKHEYISHIFSRFTQKIKRKYLGEFSLLANDGTLACCCCPFGQRLTTRRRMQLYGKTNNTKYNY